MQVHCSYHEKCSGCQYLLHPYAKQEELKINELRGLLQTAQIPLKNPLKLISAGVSGLRDRVDLVFHRGQLGLYEKDSREILDIAECQQLSPALQGWLTEVRKIRWPITKGSLRLRVGPHGQRALWLDFANVDIKKILDEKTLLQSLQSQAFVEIGQRHKVPVLVDGQYKLKDPSPQVWFQTWIEDQAVDLYCSVGSFTQAGFVANKALVKVISRWLDQTNAHEVLEFGSGIGNLSFPALGRRRQLTACEIDAQALEGFKLSLEALQRVPGFADISSRVQILRGDFQNKNPQDFQRFDTVLVNPPRSGLKSFLQPLVGAKTKPKYFIYMSCFPESFVEDSKALVAAGYEVQDLAIVDQFPQTRHYEVLCLFKNLAEDAAVAGGGRQSSHNE